MTTIENVYTRINQVLSELQRLKKQIEGVERKQRQIDKKLDVLLSR